MKKEFVKFIKTDEIRFKYAKGMRDIIGNEFHTYHEIFFFISGDAEFISEFGTEKLLPFTTVVIPKETFHCFAVLGDDADYCRCVFNFEAVNELNAIIEKKLHRIFLFRDENITELFFKLKSLAEGSEDNYEEKILMKALFAQILVCLRKEETKFNEKMNPVTKELVELINRDIDKDLTVKYLAEKMHISESHIAHIFKRDLHIPVHKYITEKRLILANNKITGGMSAMQAASECGFSDYSGFYRQYKKMFGTSPRKSKK